MDYQSRFFRFPWIKKDSGIILEQCWTLHKVGNYELWISRSGIGFDNWSEEED